MGTFVQGGFIVQVSGFGATVFLAEGAAFLALIAVAPNVCGGMTLTPNPEAWRASPRFR